MTNGAVIYHGPSKIDGQPIVAILTGLKGKVSKNRKTGKMAQLWILRSDISPIDAVRQGQDVSICGDCKHRGSAENGLRKRTCYVNLRAPHSIYSAMLRGAYEEVSEMDRIQALGEGLRVRLGAYGDPAALPASLLATLVSKAHSWTGYTHQWRQRPDLRFLVMASVDNELEYKEAAYMLKWRTFRVRTKTERLDKIFEIVCPASEEGGVKTQCAKCHLCDGNHSAFDGRANIAVIVHGVGASSFRKSRLVVVG